LAKSVLIYRKEWRCAGRRPRRAVLRHSIMWSGLTKSIKLSKFMECKSINSAKFMDLCFVMHFHLIDGIRGFTRKSASLRLLWFRILSSYF